MISVRSFTVEKQGIHLSFSESQLIKFMVIKQCNFRVSLSAVGMYSMANQLPWCICWYAVYTHVMEYEFYYVVVLLRVVRVLTRLKPV